MNVPNSILMFIVGFLLGKYFEFVKEAFMNLRKRGTN